MFADELKALRRMGLRQASSTKYSRKCPTELTSSGFRLAGPPTGAQLLQCHRIRSHDVERPGIGHEYGESDRRRPQVRWVIGMGNDPN